MKKLILVAVLTAHFCLNIFAGEDSHLQLKNSDLQYFISSDLPKGRYKIWDMTRNQQVGEDISKESSEESFGKMSLFSGQLNNKFAILDSEGALVAT